MGSLDPLNGRAVPHTGGEPLGPSRSHAARSADSAGCRHPRVRPPGAAAAVLILGSDGVAAAAAAGVLMTVTGTVGGLCFAAWAGADRLGSVINRAWSRRAHSRAQRSR
jgi:hypothetical protein